MYKVIGTRKNGQDVNSSYDNFKVAKFEYDAIKLVAKDLKLLKNDTVLEEFSIVAPKVVKYIVSTQFKDAKFTFKELAYKHFNQLRQSNDWVTLYAESEEDKKILDCYVKGA